MQNWIWEALYYAKLMLRVIPYFQVLALFKSFPFLTFMIHLYSNHYQERCILFYSYKSCKQLSLNNITTVTLSKLSSLSCYVLIATNKRLLISESHGDSNRCIPCRGKPDQHATRFPHSIHVWPSTICISLGPHIATFRTVINRVE
jgi:hypothetical protein